MQRGIGANVQGGIVIGPCFGSDHCSARAISGGGKPKNWVMDFAQKIGTECGSREGGRSMRDLRLENVCGLVEL